MVGVVLGVVIAFPALALDAWRLEGDVTLSEVEAGWFVSVAQTVSVAGSIIGGYLNDVLGPRRLLLAVLPLLASTWPVLLTCVHNLPLLLTVRVLQGLMCSAATVSVYIYPCEVIEARRRGAVGVLPDTAFSLGFMLTYFLSAILHWSTVILIMPLFFLPCVVVVFLVPESPSWLMQRGRLEEAKAVLQQLRAPDVNVEKEVLGMGPLDECGRSSASVVRQPRLLLPVLASIVLMVLKEATGQIVVVLFVVHIFRKVNVGILPHVSSLLVGSARLVANIACSFLMGRLPRRTLLISASLAASVAIAVLGDYFFRQDSQVWPQWVPLACLSVFVVAYGAGIGPVTCLMATELLPGAVRGLGSGLAGSALNASQFTLTFAATQAGSGFYICLWSYAAGSACLAAFTLLLPETRNKSLRQIEEHWADVSESITGKKWCACLRRGAPEDCEANVKNKTNDGELV
ncbi:facilitated trehalose transporter Tret1-like isoform X2 [Penaeus japonicus]|nr:facilitated trehalose transporter Tret1-like isoform X2 [Penaeus japonicus]XP_042877817.1 facilitated trehalose transporter Tret1-like isoform X2 [Penaeus japonicus]XP_042877818.1 facilitated trehalose transporter Tret1-like isoform X2 [Penaeus japonicus]